MRPRVMAAGVALATGAAAGAFHLERRAPDPPALDAITRPSGPVVEAFGINEAITIPRKHIESGALSPEQEAADLAEDARLVQEVGATWVRANSPVYPYLDQQSMEASGWDWSRPDRWVSAVQDAKLNALVVLGPWPGNRTASYTRHYLPDDMDAYAAYVTRVVERYDGDGVDDMPGLTRPIHHWEVDNEPDLHDTLPPKGVPHAPAPGTFETPEEYAQVLLVSARAIHAADPQATVLSAGMYRPHHKEGRAYLSSVLSHDGVLDAIDVLSLHCYFDDDGLGTVERTMATARELAPGKPVWITETGVPSVSLARSGKRARPWGDEAWQGRMVAAVYGEFLAQGAAKVFWHTLADPPDAASHLQRAPMSTNSLFGTVRDRAQARPGKPRQGAPDQRVIKPAGRVYSRLSQLVVGTDLSDLLARSTDQGRMLKTHLGWLAYWGSPAAPTGTQLAEGLPEFHTSPPKAPAWYIPAAPPSED